MPVVTDNRGAGLPPHESPSRKHPPRWWAVLSRLLFILIAAEVGIVLLVFPWLELWSRNFLSGGSPGWHEIWMNSYFRGAVSGLGAVNLCLSVAEIIRLFKPAANRALSIQ